MAKNVLSNPGRALGLTAKRATSAASKNSKQALSTLSELITFYNTGKGLCLGKFLQFIQHKWTKNVKDFTHSHP